MKVSVVSVTRLVLVTNSDVYYRFLPPHQAILGCQLGVCTTQLNSDIIYLERASDPTG